MTKPWIHLCGLTMRCTCVRMQVFICILKTKFSISTDGAVDSGVVQNVTKSGGSARGRSNKLQATA